MNTVAIGFSVGYPRAAVGYFESSSLILRLLITHCTHKLSLVSQKVMQRASKHFQLDECFRNSHRMRPIKKGVLENFAKFTGKYPCQSLFFNKVEA